MEYALLNFQMVWGSKKQFVLILCHKSKQAARGTDLCRRHCGDVQNISSSHASIDLQPKKKTKRILKNLIGHNVNIFQGVSLNVSTLFAKVSLILHMTSSQTLYFSHGICLYCLKNDKLDSNIWYSDWTLSEYLIVLPFGISTWESLNQNHRMSGVGREH